MIEVEVFGEGLAPEAPTTQETQRLCALVAASRGIGQGHVAIEYVSAARIAELNARHRAKDEPTDVLSFPIDGIEPLPDAGEAQSQRELGDIVICPAHTADIHEAIVHGMLHLLGMDHETDQGEMLALQAQLLEEAGG
jgi:probable rRNA maturation factor